MMFFEQGGFFRFQNGVAPKKDKNGKRKNDGSQLCFAAH
jgi:hypothetical protein